MYTSDGSLGLVYAASTKERQYANFGDALSPIVIHLLTGGKVKHLNFNSDCERIAAIGTILHNFSNNTLHVWGTGLDVTRNIRNADKKYFDPRDMNIDYKIHAVRGRITEAALSCFGVSVSGVYGDPAILLRKMLKTYVGDKKNGKIGVICHLTELEDYSPDSLVKEELKRYKFDSDGFKLINPITNPDPLSVVKKVKEIAECSYILSASLHGLIIAEAFNVPCAMLSSLVVKSDRFSIFDYNESLDHRFRDFYSGMDEPSLLAYRAPYNISLGYSDVKSFLDSFWSPIKNFDEVADKLANAFPVDPTSYKDNVELSEEFFLLKV